LTQRPVAVAAALNAAARQLRAAGIADARRDAALLLADGLGLDRLQLLSAPQRPLAPAEAEAFAARLARRAAGEPVSRILGRRAFWSLELALAPAVLDPRADSESVVEAALAGIADRTAPLRLLDLGTGSGALLLALLSELPAAWGVGIDIDPAAAAVAAANAAGAGLAGRAAFLAGDWGGALAGRFDLVVANPPYIASAEIDGLAAEVRLHDPRRALDGGPDGLACYRRLAGLLAGLLVPGGGAVLECGRGQAASVGRLLADAGLVVGPAVRDLGGVERAVVARAPGSPVPEKNIGM